MQAWYHCENVYPFVPQEVLDRADSVRASLPNKYCDPKIAAELFEECLDEHLLCDELGVNIVSIEHHSGINSLYGASPMILGILARQTKKVRILSLGTLISIRPDPVRVAEEYATADVISRGRLEIGFVKSGDSEMVSGNANPVGYVDRFWEAIDLIQKTLTSHDGPFSWEGKHFTHRHVNIWPPAYQRPHPPMWAATGDPETSAELGRRGMINALVLRGPEASKRAFDAYRDGAPRGRVAGARHRPLRLCGAVLCRRHRRGGPAGRQQNAVVPQHQPQAVAANVEDSCRAACRPRSRRRTIARSPAPGARRAAPGRQPDRDHRRAGDRPRHPVCRQPGHGLQADHGHLRQGRRVRPLDLYRPLGLSRPPGSRERHPADGQGGAAAPAGGDSPRRRRAGQAAE